MTSATGGTTTIVLPGGAGVDRTTVMAALAVWIGEREAANGGAGENGIVTRLDSRLTARQGHSMPPALPAGQIDALEPL